MATSSIILLCIFLVSLCALLHTYILFPLFLKWKKPKKVVSNQFDSDYTPKVSVIMAVYNESQVILEKLMSLESQNYPSEKVHVYIGSDCSDDGSNDIIEDFIRNKPNYSLLSFSKRRGKIQVINDLGFKTIEEHGRSQDHIILYTDANVILDTSCLKNLVRNFSSPDIAVVDANMLSQKMMKEGISMAERAYMDMEVMIKHYEGRIWGLMQGAFGGCYCIRSTYFVEVPPHFIVDDFFITFNALLKGGKAINDLEAKCYESANHEIVEEFKRKARISSGNFQNLKYFLKRFRQWSVTLGWVFFSHKILRWFGPFLLMGLLLSSILLWYSGIPFFDWITFILMLIMVIIPILDRILSMVGVQIGIFRKVRYFMTMNLALLKGFIKYVKGIQTSIWEPPKRS